MPAFTRTRLRPCKNVGFMSSEGNYRNAIGCVTTFYSVTVSLLWYIEAALSQTLKLPTHGAGATIKAIPHINLRLHQRAPLSIKLRLERLYMELQEKSPFSNGTIIFLEYVLLSIHSFTVYLSSTKNDYLKTRYHFSSWNISHTCDLSTWPSYPGR